MLGGDFQRWMLRSRRSAAKGGFDIETEKLVVEYASTLSRCAPAGQGTASHHHYKSSSGAIDARTERELSLRAVGKASVRGGGKGLPPNAVDASSP